MKIAFDSQIFTTQRYGGVSRYLVRLAESLIQSGHEAKVFGKWHINYHLAESEGLADARMRRILKYPWRTRRGLHHYNDFVASRRMSAWPADIVHESYFGERAVGPKGLPRVCTVHDMIDERMPDLFGDRTRATELKRKAVMRSDHIICISKQTKEDLIELFGVEEERISVVYHGSEWLSSTSSKLVEGSCRQSEDQTKPYFLYVGQRGHYKNFKVLVQAFGASPTFKNDFQIKLFGGPELGKEEFRMLEQMGVSSAAITHESGSDLDLARLYRNAVALVYPSTYEGFGLPPLEAMTQGCPVIASSSAPMPEIIGPAAEYFDPNSADDHLRALNRVAFSTARRQELIELGHARAKEFSWRRCGLETLKVYRTIGR
jgi:glycosyltransferase involved in cell wall biosynthesis